MAALVEKREALVQATRTPPPAFSWCLPEAHYPQSAPIQEFLRGPLQGPQNFVVGGGIGNARNMCSNHQFSANFTPGGVGQNAHVTVTKTKHYHELKVREYNANVTELLRIESEMRALGGKVVVPPQRALVNVSRNQQRPPKKAKVRAAMPEGVEVIAID